MSLIQGRRQCGLEGQSLALAQIRNRVSLVSSLLCDLEQAILPLCASVASAVMGTPSTGHGSYCCYLLTSLKSSDHWGRRKLGDKGVYGIVTTGRPRQQKFTIKRKQMKGITILMNTYFVSGIQQPLFSEAQRSCYLPKVTQQTKKTQIHT